MQLSINCSSQAGIHKDIYRDRISDRDPKNSQADVLSDVLSAAQKRVVQNRAKAIEEKSIYVECWVGVMRRCGPSIHQVNGLTKDNRLRLDDGSLCDPRDCM